MFTYAPFSVQIYRQLDQRFPNWATRDFARGATKVVAFVVGVRAFGVWCRVCSAPRNFTMGKYSREDLFVKRLRNNTSQ